MTPELPKVSSQLALQSLAQAAGLLMLLVGGLSVSSCSIYATDGGWNNDDDVPERVQGMQPVYGREDAYEVYSDVVRTIEDGSSIFREGDLLFTVDTDRGIHISDNTNPSRPRQLAFIRILGVRTASVTGTTLYANNFEDFITIDISDLDNVEVVDRQQNFYETFSAFPPNYNGFFECIDPDRGPVLNWEVAILINPRCRI